jgi:ABC-2 type transport system ATP-binding protein
MPAATVPSGPAAILVVGLTKRYAGEVLALDGLSMAVPTGSVFGLLGPNGAGKTTCLRLLAGLTRPTAGRAVVNGTVVATDPLTVRRGLGYLEQDPRAYGWMTGREQLSMLGRLHGLDGAELERAVDDALVRVDLVDAAGRRTGTYSGGMRQRLGIAGRLAGMDGATLKARTAATLEQVGLADAGGRRIGGYSGGMRQRLGIAQALVADPNLLVLDEPVSSLDPEGRRDLLALISDLKDRATIVFSTHVLADVERICDRVGILDHGRLVTEGPLDDLLGRYAQPLYRLDPEPGQVDAIRSLTERLRGLPWVDRVEADGSGLVVSVTDADIASRELLGVVVAASVRLAAFERARPSLEDVFLRLVGADA